MFEIKLNIFGKLIYYRGIQYYCKLKKWLNIQNIFLFLFKNIEFLNLFL